MLCVDVDRETLTYTAYPDDEDAVMSAKDCFRHEIFHAVDKLIRKTMKTNFETPPSDKEYDDGEEESVIKETDQGIAGKKRYNHRGIPIKTDSLDSKKGPMKGTTEVVDKKSKVKVIKFNKWRVQIRNHPKPRYAGPTK
jgi:hypothetical protein